MDGLNSYTQLAWLTGCDIRFRLDGFHVLHSRMEIDAKFQR